jgi:hypothetical protein
MKIRNVIFATLSALGILAVFLLITATLSVAQTDARTPASAIATAQIPFDFWIDDTHLAAGEYALYPVLRERNTLVLIRNTKTQAQEQVFLVPTGDPVRNGDYELVFVVHNGQHYLRELWKSDGKAVLTSQYGLRDSRADTRSEVPLVGQTAGKTAAGVPLPLTRCYPEWRHSMVRFA